ncbi:hypothetical protein HNR36_002998 [Ureibacillus thermosphaericus]|uniref:Uncharacterized protein n=1 Tax=Ureibacillus thermosphaericus TaxID=51173 RepID=A0A840PXG9_URETH|nr:hypothetical protein [Ureibacillus thermosphaericus]
MWVDNMVIGEIKKDWEVDFESYEMFLANREYFTNTELKSRFLRIYQKIYLYTTLTNGICELDKRSKIEQFFFECKNNMIISYDLANLNYINASKQILRSCIESFFRLSLGISRYIEYCNRQVELNNFPQIILNSFLQLRFNSLLN